MVSRNFHAAKLLQVRRQPLRVEQRELPGAQMLDQTKKRDLGGIGHAMKHRFAKKRAADRDAVEAAGELAFVPSFD